MLSIGGDSPFEVFFNNQTGYRCRVARSPYPIFDINRNGYFGIYLRGKSDKCRMGLTMRVLDCPRFTTNDNTVYFS